MPQPDDLGGYDALVGLYTEFLMDRGVDLYYDEPEPVYEDYLWWHLSDGPTHLTTADVEWRTQMACRAWLAAERDRQMRLAWAVSAQMTVHFLAAKKAMMEVCLESKGSVPEEFTLSARRHIVQRLWQEQLWHEPWCSLVNQEFPGPEPTAKDIEEIEALEKLNEGITGELLTRVDEVKAILFEYGYFINTEESELVFGLVSTAVLFTIVNTNRPETDISRWRPELEKLVEEASNPCHPVWVAVIDHLVSAKPFAIATDINVPTS